MDLYSLTNFIPISTNRFTQKCNCFESISDIFLFLKEVKATSKILIVDYIMNIYLLSKNFRLI